jgi:hypothetical protein
MRNSAVLVLVLSTTFAASAAGPEPKYRAPRTEYGQPDLQGVWNFSSDVPLQRPTALADKKFFAREELETQRAAKGKGLETIAKIAPVEAVGLSWLDYGAQIENLRTSLITYPDNGRLPELVEGVRRVPGPDDIIAALNEAKDGPPPALLALFGAGKKDGPEDFGTSDRCLSDDSLGPPLIPGFDSNFVQVIQANGYVVLRTEPLHDARIVPLDGRPHVGETLRSWSGDSRGRWDGDTLVVETRNFNNRTRSFAGAGRSRDKVVTERFTRVAKNALEYEATIVDPKTFKDKVVVSFPMAKVDARIYESACHEGNYSMANALSGARKQEQEAANTQQ